MKSPQEIAEEIIESMYKFSSCYRPPKKNNNLKQNEMAILLFIAKYNKENACGINPSKISELMCMSRSSITHLLNSLAKTDYIKRVFCESDRRMREVLLTENGEKIIAPMFEQFYQSVYKLVEDLGEKDSAELLRLLKLSTKIMTDSNLRLKS